MTTTDVVIIGAGAVGCSIARELSKYKVDVVVVEKNDDVGGGASRSNSAIIHTGYDASPGSLESQLVVAANPMYDKLTKDLDIPYKKVGAILPAFSQEQLEQLPGILEKAFQNHVYDVEYLTRDQLLKMEPNLNPEVKAGLYIPRENIIDPFLLVIAYAENAAANGVQFMLNTEVTGIELEDESISIVRTTSGDIKAKYVVNAAGLFCDSIAAMVGKDDYFVNPRRGQFFIFDKATKVRVRHIVLPIPTKVTKGKLIAPTIHNNLLVGPTAEELEDKYNADTTVEGLDSIKEDVRQLVPNLVFSDAITQYSGLRANRNPEGLHIDTYDDVKGYVNLSGVRSTGITASASIGVYVTRLLQTMGVTAEHNPDFIATRKGIPRFSHLSREEQRALIEKDKLYGTVICRCETVTEGQIVEALNRPLPPRSLDAMKRRVWASVGRCQGGFCVPRILEIMSREIGVPMEEINKNLPGSYMTVGKVRGGEEDV